MPSTIKKFLLIAVSSSLFAQCQALPIDAKGLFTSSKSKLTYNAQGTGPAQILELEANKKYKLEIRNLNSNVVQAQIKSEKDIDKRIDIADRVSKVRKRASKHILIVKDVIEPFSDMLLLQTYVSKDGKFIEDKRIPLRINIKSQTGCAEKNQPVCGKLLFSPIDIAEKTYRNKCEAKRAGATFITNKPCSL